MTATKPAKCFVIGCKNPARWTSQKLYGDGATNLVCDECKPDMAKRPESLRHFPFFYEVRPLR